jgi:hypothetical protein
LRQRNFVDHPTHSHRTEFDGQWAGDAILEELQTTYLRRALTITGLRSMGRGLEIQSLKSFRPLPKTCTHSHRTEFNGQRAGDSILEELKQAYLRCALTVTRLSSMGSGLEMQFLKS